MSISIASKYIDGMRRGLGVDLSITVDPLSGDSFKLGKQNIVQGSFVIDRSVCSSDTLEIGSAMAAELNFTIKNEQFTDSDGNTKNPATIAFEGAQLTVNLTLHNPQDSDTYTLPMGIFTVDEPPRKLSTINIKALDRMMRFDVAHDGAVGSSLLAAVQHCCSLAGVTLSSSATTFLNSFTGVYILPNSLSTEDGLTCRQVLMWVGEMTASCAYVDENGKLNFKQYPSGYNNAISISEADRYSSDMQESDIVVTGITVTPAEGDAVTIGKQGYEWNIEGNLLLVNPDEMTSAPLGYNSLSEKFFSYRPFKATTKAFPHLWPLDAIVFSKGGEGYDSVITHHTWKLNGNSSLSAVGKTATQNGYATYGAFTAKQKAILERAVKGQVKTQISGYQQAILDVNEQAQGALGLYNTKDEDTGVIYFHNQPDIADSTYIYMETTAGRFMATGANAWNDGNPVWTNAWTSMGQIVAHSMAAGSITTDMLSVGVSNIHNLFKNGDFYKFSEWNMRNSSNENSFQGVSIQNAATLGIDSIPAGDLAARILRGNKTTSYPRLVCDQKIPVTPGAKYTASFYMKSQDSEDNRYAAMSVEWLDSSYKYLSANLVEGSHSTDWNRFATTYTAPAKAAYAQIMFYLYYKPDYTNSQFSNSYVYVAGFMFESNSTLHDWDNGRTHGGGLALTENGIDIYNGAIKIYNPKNGEVVFKADENGYLSLLGSVRTNSQNNNSAEFTYGGLNFYNQNTLIDYIQLINWKNINDEAKLNITVHRDLIIGEGALHTGYGGAYGGSYDVFAGLRHYRGVGSMDYSCGFGIGKISVGDAQVGTASIELKRPSTKNEHTPHYDYICARLDIAEAFYTNEAIRLRGRCSYNNDTYSKWLVLGVENLVWEGEDMIVDGVSFKDLVSRVTALEK